MKMSMFITLAVSIMFSALTNAADYAVALGYADVNETVCDEQLVVVGC